MMSRNHFYALCFGGFLVVALLFLLSKQDEVIPGASPADGELVKANEAHSNGFSTADTPSANQTKVVPNQPTVDEDDKKNEAESMGQTLLAGFGAVELLDHKMGIGISSRDQVQVLLVKGPKEIPFLRVEQQGNFGSKTPVVMSADKVLVQFKENIDRGRIETILAEHGLAIGREFRNRGLFAVTSATTEEAPSIDFVERALQTFGTEIADAVESVDPDYIVYALGTPGADFSGGSVPFLMPEEGVIWDPIAATNSSLVSMPSSRSRIQKTMAAAGLPPIQGKSVRRMTFDPPSFVGRRENYKPGMTEVNMRLEYPASGIYVQDAYNDGYPDNGGYYARVPKDAVLKHSQNVAFTVHAMDISEYSAVYPNPTLISLTGTKLDGSTVTHSFTTDGVFDGTGPAVDFERITLPSAFTGLSKLTFNNSLFVHVDNIDVTVEGQEIPPPVPPTLPQLYEMTFDPPVHAIDQTITVGGNFAPRSVNFGDPIVRSSIGGMTNAVEMLSTNSSGGYEQFRVGMDEGADAYRVEMDVYVNALGPNIYGDSFSVLFDGPPVQRFDLEENNKVSVFQSGVTGGFGNLGTYQMQTINHLRFDIDMVQGKWTIRMNGNIIGNNGNFNNSTDITNFRVHWSDSGYGANNAWCAVDNVQVFAYHNGDDPDPVGPKLSTTTSAVDFGSTLAGDVAYQSVRMSNSGDEPLTVNSVTINNTNFSQSSVFPATMVPGEFQDILVKFEPLDPGNQSGLMTIISTDPASPTSISLVGTAVADDGLKLSENHIEVSSPGGGLTSNSLTLENRGATTLNWTLTPGNDGISSGTDVVPDDTYTGYLWGLKDPAYFGSGIAAAEAWKLTTGSPLVVVGVIDTGIDYNHQDLNDNIWVNEDEIPGNNIDDDNNGYIDDIRGWDFSQNDSNPMDGNGHGTHVAGTIGAEGNNGRGVVGVGWKTKLMPIKFLADQGYGTTAWAIDAIDYATENGANLTNNSWGGGGYNSALKAAITRARDSDQLFVAAAGNESTNTDYGGHYPSSYDVNNVISVASTNIYDLLSSFSNYGRNTVDLAAPGEGIYSSFPGNLYQSYSGTSMASPHVAGSAALILAQNPQLSYLEIKQTLLGTVDLIPAASGKTVTGGRLNVLKALKAVDVATWLTLSQYSGSIPAGQSATVHFNFNAAGLTHGQYSQMVALTSNDTKRPSIGIPVVLNVGNVTLPGIPGNFSASDDLPDFIRLTWNSVANATSYSVYRNTVENSGNATQLASGITAAVFQDSTATANTVYYYWTKAHNANGSSVFSASDSGLRVVATGPSIDRQPGGLSVITGEDFSLDVSLSSSDGTVSYQWFRGNAGDTSSPVGSNSSTLTLPGAGNFNYWVRITDNTGSSDSSTALVKSIPAGLQMIAATDGLFSDKVRVSWLRSLDAVSYNIYRNLTNSPTSALYIGNTTSHFFNDTSAVSGTNYYYFVKAVDSDGDIGVFDSTAILHNQGARSNSAGRVNYKLFSDMAFGRTGNDLFISSLDGNVDALSTETSSVSHGASLGRSIRSLAISLPHGSELLLATEGVDNDEKEQLFKYRVLDQFLTEFNNGNSTNQGAGTASVIALDSNQVLVGLNNAAAYAPLYTVNQTNGLFNALTNYPGLSNSSSIGSEHLFTSTPDGTSIIVIENNPSSGNGQFTILNPSTNSFSPAQALAGRMGRASLSRDGTTLGVAERENGSANRAVRVISASTGAELATLVTNGSDILFSPVIDEAYVVDLDVPAIRAYSTTNWDEIFVIPITSQNLPSSLGTSGDIEISADGGHIALAWYDGIHQFEFPLANPDFSNFSLSVSTEDPSGIALNWQELPAMLNYQIFSATEDDFSASSLVATVAGSEVYFNHTTASYGAPQYYWIRGESYRGITDVSPAAVGIRPIGSPSSFAVSNGTYSDFVRVTFGRPGGATEVQIFRSNMDNFSSASLIGTTAGSFFNDISAIPAQNYYYWARGINGAYVGTISASHSGYRQLEAPSNFISQGTNSYIRLSWGITPYALRYEIERSNSSGIYSVIASLDSSSTEYFDNSVVIGQNYQYRIRAITGSFVSNYAFTNGRREVTPPSEISATLDDFDGVKITWNEIHVPGTYLIFRSKTIASAQATFIGSTLLPTFTDDTAEPGVTYHYFLKYFHPQVGGSYFSAAVPGRRFGGPGQIAQQPVYVAAAPLVSEWSTNDEVTRSFSGLLSSPENRSDLLGVFTGKVSRKNLTVSIRYDGVLFVGRLSIDENGAALSTLENKKLGRSIDIAMQLMTSDETGAPRLHGTVSENGEIVADLESYSSTFNSRTNPAPFAGAYTLILPHDSSADPTTTPFGSGVGTGTISTNGSFKFALVLADQQRVTLSGYAGADSEMTFYTATYGRAKQGVVAGRLTVRDVPNISDIDGEIFWVRPPNERIPSNYQAGFDLKINAVGSQFIPATKGDRLLSVIPDGDENVMLSLTGGNLGFIPSNRFLNWNDANRLTFSDRSISLAINSRNGLITGSCTLNEGPHPVKTPAFGVVFQKQQFVGGSFVGAEQSGLLTIEPSSPPEIEFRNGTGNLISQADTINFGDIGSEGGVSSRIVRITNGGEGNLRISADSDITGENAGRFEMVASRSGFLEPGESTLLRIAYHPTGIGNDSAFLKVFSNDRQNNPFLIQLSGNGIPGNLTYHEPGTKASNLAINPPLDPVQTTASAIFESENAGTYAGFTNIQNTQANIIFTVSNKGVFSGTVTWGRSRSVVSGVVEPDGSLSVSRFSGGTLPGLYGIGELQFHNTANFEPYLVGTFSSENETIPFALGNTTWPKGSPPPIVGKYTLVVPSVEDLGNGYPAGDSFALTSVNSSGAVKTVVFLANGSVQTGNSRLTKDLRFDFYGAIRTGSFAANLRFEDTYGISDIHGNATWILLPSSSSSRFPGGFTLRNQAVIGSAFTAPAVGDRAFPGLLDRESNAMLSLFSDDKNITWTDRNRINLITSIAGELLSKTSVSASNGLVRGLWTFKNPSTRERRSISFSGVIFQKQGVVSGFSLEGESAGHFGIIPSAP